MATEFDSSHRTHSTSGGISRLDVLQVLTEAGYLTASKIYLSTVAGKVAAILGIAVDETLTRIITEEFLLQKRTKWHRAMEYTLDDISLKNHFEIAILKTFFHQTGDLWGDISKRIGKFNSQQGVKFPKGKGSISLALSGKESLNILNISTILGLWIPPEMTHSGARSENLRPIWEKSLDIEFISRESGETLKNLDSAEAPEKMDSLRETLICLKKIRGTKEWRTAVLNTLKQFENATEIYLGHSRWITLSRGILGREKEFISRKMFYQFLETLQKNEFSSGKKLDIVLLEYLQENASGGKTQRALKN